MISDTTSHAPPSVLTWLTAIETLPTTGLHDFPRAQISPSVRRKRQRSVEISVSPLEKRSTSRSLDGIEKPVHEPGSWERCKGGRVCTLVGREPLDEIREGKAVFNMAANSDVCLTFPMRNAPDQNHHSNDSLQSLLINPVTLPPLTQLPPDRLPPASLFPASSSTRAFTIPATLLHKMVCRWMSKD